MTLPAAPTEPLGASPEPANVPAADPRARDYAIVIGISRYPYFSKLDGPENDAVEFHEWVTSPDGGGVPPDRAKLIRSSDFQQQDEPTVQAVIAAFDAVIKPAIYSGQPAGRRLYFYLAGHGFGAKLDDSALFMANADSDLGLNYHIAGKRYADWVAAASVFEEVVLLMDCCRDIYRTATILDPPWPAKIQPPGARWLHAFATQWGFKAYERPITGAQKVQGVFTKALLAGLRGGACDPSGRITAETLRDFIINDVAARAKENEEQRPRIIAPDSIVFAEGRAPQGAHVTVNFPRPENVSAEVVDGALKVVARGAANAPLLVEKLPPGLYKVRVAAAPPREQFFQITSELKVTFDFTA